MKYTFTDLVMGFDNFYPELVYNAYKFNVVEEGNTVTITFGFYVGNDVKVYQSVAKDNKWVEKDKEILWIDEATVNGVPTGFDILGDVVYVESNSGTWTVGFDETLGHLASSRFYSLSTTDGRFGAIHKGNDKDLIDIGHIDTILVNGYLVSNRDLTDMVVDTNTNALYFIESESGPDIDTFNRSLVIKKTSLDNINGNFEEGEFLDKTSDHVVNIASLGGERIFAIGDPDGVLLKDGEPYPSRGRVLFMYDSDLNELDCVEVPTGDDIIRAELIVTEDEVAVGTFMNMKESRRSAYRE